MKEAAEAIVNARSIIFICTILNYNFLYSVEIYGRLSTDLLPTPAKSHYIFNLRDLSKCIQGIGMQHVHIILHAFLSCTFRSASS